MEFSCATVTKSLEEAVADPTWVQSTNNIYGICSVLVGLVNMAAVNNTNRIWHVLICVVYCNNKQVRK